jgi:hypothetical protein
MNVFQSSTSTFSAAATSVAIAAAAAAVAHATASSLPAEDASAAGEGALLLDGLRGWRVGGAELNCTEPCSLPALSTLGGRTFCDVVLLPSVCLAVMVGLGCAFMLRRVRGVLPYQVCDDVF